jgi:hypothetical protein
LGIGTTIPGYKLHVVSSGSPIARFDGSSVVSSSATEIDILGPQSNGDLNLGVGGSTFTDATNNIQNKGYVTAAGGLSALNLRSDSGYVQITTGGITSANERMRITSDGNVGIGTTSPISKLNLYGSGSNLSVFKVDGGNGTLFEVTDNLSGSLFSVNTIAGLPVLEVFSDNTIVAGTYGSNVLVITGSNVGIGTASPTAKLHVEGSQITLNTENSYAEKTLYFRFSNGARIQSDSYLTFYTAGTPTEKMRILSDGNVGIGFTTPVANLHVFGPTMIVGDTNTTQNVRQTIVGSTTANASTTAKKIFVCGHTSTGTINVTAIITSVSTASATATFSFANAFGNNVTPNRLSYISLNSTITSIDCSYNNSGYQMEISVTYTGATAPTLYFTAEGMGSGIWTL